VHLKAWDKTAFCLEDLESDIYHIPTALEDLPADDS
jgi:hypothetical protein